jgi:hypothetical protein
MSHIDLQFRPASYSDHPDPVSAILSNIKGQNRRRMAHIFITGQGRPELGALPSGFLEPSLDRATRSYLGSQHPSWMGGEYLPDYLPREVEIARIVLDSVTRDVISFRARRRCGGRRILYRVVDEYPDDGGPWTCRPASSVRPLTLGGLIQLIDGARSPDFLGQTGSLPLLYLEYQEGCDPDELLTFVTVESDCYPHLTLYYQEKARLWVERKNRISP